MPPLPPPPPAVPVAADQDALLEQSQRLVEVTPRLAFEKASLLRDPLLRDRIRRDAYIAMARTEPKEAAALLGEVIEARWLGSIHFAQALDIAWFTVRGEPELSRRLLLATAARHPAAAMREARQYIDLPYGPAILAAAKEAGREPEPEIALLHIRQNPEAAASLRPGEVIRLAAGARTEDERDTALQLLRKVDWTAVDTDAGLLRSALALLADTGSLPNVPATAVRKALAGIDDAEDPVAAAVKAASILAAAPAGAQEGLPDTRLGRLLRTYRSIKADPTLSVAALFPDGVCVQRYVFHNDDDGVESFTSFASAYAGDANWKIERTDEVIHMTGRGAKGRRIEIYANIPVDLQVPANFGIAAAVQARQGAVTRALQEQNLTPTVLVHRGHDHHFSETRKLLKPEARLVYLGSCNGMENVEDVVTHCRRAQMIATRGVGTTSVNDAFLRSLNQRLLEGGETLDWDVFWDGLRPSLGGSERFSAYVPPHKNEQARFLAAWYRQALSAP